ncbi:glycosyltransferase [Rhizobium sp. ICMP 5592]|uniref:glycosyltransferase n=1 Tax=Rhizobium sp. ICMP 5592 TaxID=2292445 RepID=UPI0012978C64|nr:glycosyltransferase [Rhizobium sp. ICMP 5592]MQB41509.1 glycosyltransferase [Rhizobium sp. ICMP 5592]
MSAAALFAVNGRFFTQNATGVQRYASNVVRALDSALAAADARAAIIAPSGTPNPGFGHMPLIQSGPLSGHPWEQITLPAQWPGRLLNLCNTAPASKADQIVCIHDANVFSAPESYNRTFRMVYQTLQPLLVRRSARIATVSHAAARQIARHLPIRIEDIAVLPNGHEHALSWDPTLAQLAPGFIAETFGQSDRRFILALGSRARHKNLALLVDAAPRLDEIGVDIVIAGGGAEIFVPGALKQRSNVHLIGRVSDHDLAYLLERALCLTFPSLTEGFGLPIVEAMARGCPVIASYTASMPEVCGEAALLASPSDPAAWIRHIRALKETPELRSELVGKGYEQVRHFSWSQTAAGYMELLERPAAHPKTYKPVTASVPRTAVIIATRGRPGVVSATVRHLLATQTLKPEAVIVSCIDLADAGDLVGHSEVTVVTGLPGLTTQRNTALLSLPEETEIVAFFDDDFIADRNWLAAAARSFRDDSQIVGFTGRVLADGVNGPGIGFEEALRLVEAAPPSDWSWIEPYSPYGCNMAFRAQAIGETRFDERLVLYGWLEDRDFAAALAKRGGRFVKCAEAFGVHMGVKNGRISGERFGYSQVVNPIYMLRKGTMTGAKVANHIICNMAMNFTRAAWPEPFVDRRGRARGNLIAIADLLRGRLEPERAARLTAKNSTGQLKSEVTTR